MLAAPERMLWTPCFGLRRKEFAHYSHQPLHCCVHANLTTEVFPYKQTKKVKKKGRKRKKEKKRKTKTLFGLSYPCPSPSNKNNIQKATSRMLIRTDQNRMKENISNEVQLFLSGNNNKRPARHNNLTHRAAASWNFPMAPLLCHYCGAAVRGERTAGPLARVAKQQRPRAPHPPAPRRRCLPDTGNPTGLRTWPEAGRHRPPSLSPPGQPL